MGFSTFVGGDPRYDGTRNQFVRPGGEAAGTFGYTVNGAISIVSGTHRIAKTSAAAMTIAPPSASEEDCRLTVVAGTAFPHTLTVTGGLGGNAADDVITFAKVGDSISLRAVALRWVPEGAPYGAVIS